MAKTTAPSTAEQPAEAPAATTAAPEAPPQPLPTRGGCWVRLTDGTLAPETPPADAAPKEQAP